MNSAYFGACHLLCSNLNFFIQRWDKSYRQCSQNVFSICFLISICQKMMVTATIVENVCSWTLPGKPKWEFLIFPHFYERSTDIPVDIRPCSPRGVCWLTLAMGSKCGDQWGRCGPSQAASTTSLCTTNTIFMSLKWDLLLYFITKNRIRKCKQDPIYRSFILISYTTWYYLDTVK